MPDLIIRGMEMPDKRTAELMHTELACVSRECDRHCENCDLVQDRDELIVAFREAIRVLEAVANAIPLPKGHGELIERNTVIDEFTKSAKAGQLKPWSIVKTAPTIIPAEGGTDDDN